MLNNWSTVFAVIDPSSCAAATFTGYWATLSWRVVDWLTSPRVVLPMLISLIVLPWLIRPLGRKRLWSGLGIGLAIAYLTISSPIMTTLGNWGLTQFVPADSGGAADAIVVLGRGGELMPQRVDVATQLWRSQRAPLIFASGQKDGPAIAQALANEGIPEEAIDNEPCSRTTEENAQFTAALLQPKGIQTIILVTDPPHMLRSLLTFHSYGFEVMPHVSPLPDSINRQRERILVLREYVGLVSYGLLGRYFPRDATGTKVATTYGITQLG